MTGGVVLATLVLNATTISALVRRLGLATPSRADRFLALSARLSAIASARAQLDALGLDDPAIRAELDAAEQATRSELSRIELRPEEELELVTRRGLFVERETYQRLHDVGLLQPVVTRTLLHEVDDQIEEVGLGRPALDRLRQRERPAARLAATTGR